MAHDKDQLGIYIDIGKDIVPRMNFTIGEHTTNVDITADGANNIGTSLLMSSFICSLGKGIPEGTVVSPGALPVLDVKGYIDEATRLPALMLSLVGGGTLTFLLSADLAAQASATLGEQARVAVNAQPTEPK